MEKRILVVEHAAFREAFTRTLRKALSPEQPDVVFVEAGSAAEARSRLGEGGLGAALIAIALPDGDGLALVRGSTTAARAARSRPSCGRRTWIPPWPSGRWTPARGGVLQGGLGAGDGGGDKEADRRRTLGRLGPGEPGRDGTARDAPRPVCKINFDV
jgi:hypothetical protein